MALIYAKIGAETPAYVETLFRVPPEKGGKLLIRKAWWNRWLPMIVTKITEEGTKPLYHMDRG